MNKKINFIKSIEEGLANVNKHIQDSDQCVAFIVQWDVPTQGYKIDIHAVRNNDEYFNCPKCGKRLSKHKFYYDGCRRHIKRYSCLGYSCSEPDCELNHNCG